MPIVARKEICEILPRKICEKLQELGEERAAEWFLGAWGGEHGMRMLGYIFPGCSIHNNALEITWKWLKANTCAKNGGRRSSIQLFTVLMLRHFSDQSKLAEASLRKFKHMSG